MYVGDTEVHDVTLGLLDADDDTDTDTLPVELGDGFADCVFVLDSAAVYDVRGDSEVDELAELDIEGDGDATVLADAQEVTEADDVVLALGVFEVVETPLAVPPTEAVDSPENDALLDTLLLDESDADEVIVAGFVVGAGDVEGDGEPVELCFPETEAELDPLVVLDCEGDGDDDTLPDMLSIDDGEACGEGVAVGADDSDGNDDTLATADEDPETSPDTDPDNDTDADAVEDMVTGFVVGADVTEGDGDMVSL